VSQKNENSGFPLLVSACASLTYYFFLRPQLLKWGTLLGESQRRLPGDELIPQPNFQMTHAINIDAPAEAIWPWLAQMGRERSGYYALDMLDNQGIPSVTFIRQDLSAPEKEMTMNGGYKIVEVEPNRQLLFAGFELPRQFGITQDLSALYLLERRKGGSTRLITRWRGFSYGPFGPLYNLIFEVMYFAFLSQQLKTIKQHGESMAYLKAAQPSAQS